MDVRVFVAVANGNIWAVFDDPLRIGVYLWADF